MRVLSLPDRLRVVALELGLTRAPRWMVVAAYEGAAELAPVRHILRRRGEGATFRTIALELTAQGLPTKRGGHRWYDSTVRTIWRGRARYAALLPTA